MATMPAAMISSTRKDRRLFRSESDPNEITMLAEWDSHDAMMASSDERGAAFQADAGTEDLEWETRIWHRLA